ncbi:ABC-2 type transport system permease protein [Paenibacillus shirakamiensis]|uniref:ABC-2 type transport system permease protein n=1 Tax=Paenibacillus shirakamiensis TaxID=1265935 RepID=A0ABS4JE46_9BACL|nr:ABC-2 family transporter protein [Paenibacillus shirakamiensis]MBP1999950.1 ABC-2 type transport system permease protein [Paenibacillus shirakamiensis]
MNRRRLYKAIFSMGIQHSMEYRFHFFLSLLGAAFPILVQYFIWTAVYRYSGQAALFSYSYGQIILYTILAGLVSKLIATQFEQQIADDIKNGGLNKYLIKPVSYFGYRLVSFLGQKVIYYGITALLLIGIIWISSARQLLDVQAVRLTLFAFTLWGALLLNFLIVYCICAIAFYLHEISYFFVITSLLINILSGGMFPLEIFGESVVKALQFTPFPYTIYFPVNVLSGKTEMAAMYQGLLVQGGWILLFFWISRLTWRASMKKYSAVGG